MSKRIDLTGKRFGAWTVKNYFGMNKYKASCWVCVCDCGSIRNIAGQTLRGGLSMSCGCLKSMVISASRKKHGHALKNTRTYRIWKAMKQRCSLHPSSNRVLLSYAYRGIDVCEEWKNSFSAFLNDMGECPENLTLDRIDNNQGYFKDNCRWATYTEQANNRRPRMKKTFGRTG